MAYKAGKAYKGVKKRLPTTPVKKVQRKRRLSDSSSSLDLSDEDGYSELDDLTSDDEDDEEDVDAAEEAHIIRSSPQPTLVDEDEEGDDEAGDEEEEEADNDTEDDDDDDNEEEEEDDDKDAVESASWDGIMSDVETEDIHRDDTDTLSLGNDSAVERRVRFDVPDSSDGDSTETDEDVVDRDFFPDIFVPQSSLDPGFRREIERDHDDDNNSDSGFWDFHGHDFPSNHNDNPFEDATSTDIDNLLRSLQEDDEATPVANPMARHDLMSAQSSRAPSPQMSDDSDLDGYQTDGDTTDEDDEPDARPMRPKTPRELAEEDTDSDVVTIIRARRGQPRVGRFTLDNPRKKPIAIMNPKTGKMMIFTPQGGRSGALDLSPEQFNFQWFDAEPESSPMVNPGNMMMSAMVSSNTFGDFMNTQAIGPEEAFFSLPSDANFFDESPNEEEQEDEEKHLHLEDFIDFDDEFDGLSGDEGSGAPENDDPILCTPSSVGRPSNGDSNMTSLLDHFETNADLVGAFRRDQANHQLISRSKATRESLAFSGPYYEGTLRGIKDGRIGATNVPISPLRKQRRTSELASSPLNTQQKRKASSQQDWGHKRQRSMPDVNVLSL